MADYLMSDACRQQMTEPAEGTGPRKPGGFACYKDCVGVVTGGYGHTAMAGAPIPRLGDVWPASNCDAVLAQDLRRWSSELRPYLDRAATRRVINAREVDAIIDLYHNCGRAILSSTLLRLYVTGAPAAQVAQHFGDWVRAGGRVVGGLVSRRRRNKEWFLTGRLQSAPVQLIDESSTAMPHVVDHPDSLVVRAFNSLRIAA